MIGALIALLSVVIFGLLIVQHLYPKTELIEKMALAYLLGLGIFTFIFFGFNALGLAFTRQFGLILLGVASGILYLTLPRQSPFLIFKETADLFYLTFKKIKHLSKIEKVLLTVLVLICLSVMQRATYWPVVDWDSIVLYDYRAQLIAKAGFFTYRNTNMLGYPLLISLSHAWLYVWGYFYPGLVHGLYYVSFLVIALNLLRKKMTIFLALFWTIVLSLTPLVDGAFMTYTNLAYTVYLLTGFFYLLAWLDQPNRAYLWLSSLLIALSYWTRTSEPFWVIVGIFWLITMLRQKKIVPALSFFVPLLIIRQSWQMFKTWQIKLIMGNYIAADYVQITTGIWSLFNWRLLPELIQYYVAFIVVPMGKYLVVFIFAALMLFIQNYFSKHKKLFSPASVCFLFILVNFLVIFAGIYFFSIFYIDWKNIGGSATRMTLFIPPLIIYFAALTFSSKTSKQPRL